MKRLRNTFCLWTVPTSLTSHLTFTDTCEHSTHHSAEYHMMISLSLLCYSSKADQNGAIQRLVNATRSLNKKFRFCWCVCVSVCVCVCVSMCVMKMTSPDVTLSPLLPGSTLTYRPALSVGRRESSESTVWTVWIEPM